MSFLKLQCDVRNENGCCWCQRQGGKGERKERKHQWWSPAGLVQKYHTLQQLVPVVSRKTHTGHIKRICKKKKKKILPCSSENKRERSGWLHCQASKYEDGSVESTLSDGLGWGRSEDLGTGVEQCCGLGKGLCTQQHAALQGCTWGVLLRGLIAALGPLALAFAVAEVQEPSLFWPQPLEKWVQSFFPRTWKSVRLDPKNVKWHCAEAEHKLGQN